MPARLWIAAGALWAALGVVLGAFGAHALQAALEQRGQLANWETGARYQLVHALALVAYGLFRERALPEAARRKDLPAWCFLVGSLFFSGSIYGLCFGAAKSALVPLTPLGGALLILGWILFAIEAVRRGLEGQRR